LFYPEQDFFPYTNFRTVCLPFNDLTYKLNCLRAF